MMPRTDRESWDRRYEGTELVWTAQPNRFLASEADDLRDYTPAAGSFDLAVVLYLHLSAAERREVLGKTVASELPGLDVELAERVRREVVTPEGEVHAIDALVRARKPRYRRRELRPEQTPGT